ncbi:DUF4148 domain-containing protein [Comamonas testosteroni]|uniref:DUF4148 domain-containing protein n=1 Tax=Comamonas testosteroni (strain DSM 14576 / KF-1) TaxID=399795 RepID=B7WTN4_COMTK|nr:MULTISPECIES: DUF4148 domain-containing protein [Comamonas]EED67440.1 conserved hypothetical protein [Comamonas testosteroni KF-1]PIG08937.1 uncharacterized protein DUF4148 [Comamonas sp. 26]RDI15453.1 uncharacterized protein DUF4148 [Comamonas sp. AG1104]WQG65605.1 DUF4148 domain-containing protein [Comamonas testosteroni]GAO72836.1 hypothetical protein CSE6_027_42730 [Comamonas sp. E6]
MSKSRFFISSTLASAAAAIVLALPGIASAGYEHPANNERGVIVHPEHFVSQKTRAQVIAETETAMKQGRLSYGESNYPTQVPSVGSSKTRAEVINELLRESPSEREARLQSMAR